jgi:Domain of unknown function (DUF4132)
MRFSQVIQNLFGKPNKPTSSPMSLTPIDREPLLEKLHQALRENYHYDLQKDNYSQLIEHLRDGSVPAPVFSYGFYGQDIHTCYWNLLGPEPRRWDETDERLLTFAFTPASGNYLPEDFYRQWITDWLKRTVDQADMNTLATRLTAIGLPESELWVGLLRHVPVAERPDSAPAQWVLNRVDAFHTANLAALGNDLGYYLNLLLKRKPGFVRTNQADFVMLTTDYYGDLSVNTSMAEAVLQADAGYYGPVIVALQQQVTHSGNYRMLQKLLIQYAPKFTPTDPLAAAYHYLEWLRQRMTMSPVPRYLFNYGYEPVNPGQSYELTTLVLFRLILDREAPAKARTYLYNWLADCSTPEAALYKLLADRLGSDSVPCLVRGLQTDPRGASFDMAGLVKELLRLLARYDYSAYQPQVWALTRHKSKQVRELAAVTLAKLGEAAIPEAEKLLLDKKGDARQTGALILSLIKTDRALALLRTALDGERNDDARDLMLDSLTGLLPVPTTPTEIATLVQGAKKRGKLDTPTFAYLPDNQLSTLYWQATGEPLDADTVRFLIYRQSRSKDIRPDAEARLVYALIDRARSHAFAGAVLKAYVEAGADAKGKACLTIGGMLGGPDETDLLRSKVNQWAEGSRGKMAEFAVQALALTGTNKALRAVEFFSRKYKSKNKNIGEAATEAFAIAAETLGIPPYDLADSIIPDFGFEGLFRAFEAGGDTYRAFVGTDFKLAFLNEDNKLSKSVPKATSAELKDEFKEIGKEIRDIVKAQSGRLEQYLVIQRRWPAERWQAFFLGNPVMFAYAVRLIWGVFDARQTLLFTFQCQEDQTLLNADGDEIDLAEAAPGDATVGMVHPLSLSAEQIAHWTAQLTDADIEPIFPQLTRPVVPLPDTADARTLTIDRQFAGVAYGGYGFVSKMDKLGWQRGSVQDSGWIASFYKVFGELGLTAIITQDGNICVGYYDENAVLGNLMFVKAGSVKFGSYTYDDPDKPTDPRLIPFGNVPPIVYSEVLADMQFFRDNAVKS